jgi:catechol 2,3-dioxygenase-like lactoylglutathione lyase family enzyme
VGDSRAARAFYEPILGAASGTWSDEPGELTFSASFQQIRLVRQRRPRALGEAGQHLALRVPRSQVSPLAERLQAAGAQVQWWREDHPSERELAPYVTDPSGNRIQLVGCADCSAPIDHVALELVDLDWAEDFYVGVLGGRVDYYHGYTTDGGAEVSAWQEGRDPVAPWTRYSRFSFRSRTNEAHATPQLFVDFGGARLALFLERAHLQEPAEDLVRGTPRLIFRTSATATDVCAHLAGPGRALISRRYRGRTIPFDIDRERVLVRAPSGNLLEMECAPLPTSPPRGERWARGRPGGAS